MAGVTIIVSILRLWRNKMTIYLVRLFWLKSEIFEKMLKLIFIYLL